MEAPDFVWEKLAEWGLSEFIKTFEGIDKEDFLRLGDSDIINVLIPKMGPRAKFKKKLKEFLQRESIDPFVLDKLTEWGLSEFNQRFQDYGIDKKAFLGLQESKILKDLIPKTGPRATFKKKLNDFLEAQTAPCTAEMMNAEMDTDLGDNSEMDFDFVPRHFEPTSTSNTDLDTEMTGGTASNSNSITGLLAMKLFTLRHQLTGAMDELMALLNFVSPDMTMKSYQIQHDRNGSYEGGQFFLFEPLESLLKDTLRNYGTELLSKTISSGHDIKDVMDGEMYQKLLRQGTLAADDLTLLWNCDEVPIYDQSNSSVWPIQFTINELPFTQRKENVIVAGLWFGQKNPDMNMFLKPFIDQCCHLADKPLQWCDSSGTVHFSKVFSLVCSSDARARPLLRNCTHFNGSYGCDWCLHQGVMVPKGKGHMRSYPYDENKQAQRSKEMMGDHAAQAESSNTPEKGVKGSSQLSKLPFFDIVFGFVPDYLHSVLLGVTKQLVKLWLHDDNSEKPWFVGQLQQIEQMDSRLQSLELPSEITESPRSLKCWDKWKAWQWRAFLLFCAIIVLPGTLQPEYLTHFLYFATSIHILLQKSISQRDIKLADRYLTHFVKDMEHLYGKENVSFNCHQLIHLAQSVQNWGPLWATSTFSFERNNGYLRALLDKNVKPEQIAQRFKRWLEIPRHLTSSAFNKQSSWYELLAKLRPAGTIDGNGTKNPLGISHHQTLSDCTKLAVEELINRPVVTSVEVYDCYSDGQTVYRSRKSGGSDCFIKLNDGSCGEIQFILHDKVNCVCTSNCLCQAIPIFLIHLYDVKSETLFGDMASDDISNIFARVEMTDQPRAVFLEDIRCKCVYVNGWFVPLPNSCERY